MNLPSYTPQQMLAPEADIILAIHALRSKSAKQTSISWLCGHQDKDCRVEDLPPEAQMNIDLDAVANEARLHKPITREQPLPGSGALLIINGKWVTTKYNEQILEALMSEAHLVTSSSTSTKSSPRNITIVFIGRESAVHDQACQESKISTSSNY